MVAISTIVTTIVGLFGSTSRLSQKSRVCDLGKTTIPFSPEQHTALGSPLAPITAVGVAFGVQNYTCSTDNVFVYVSGWDVNVSVGADRHDRSTGAVAELLNVSCLASTNNSTMSTIHQDLFNVWNNSSMGSTTVQELIETLPGRSAPGVILGQHYFIKNAAGDISPVWDFRATEKFKGVENAVMVGKALANMSDADPTKNIPWLSVGKVSGDISDEVYRIFTVGGVAPPSVSSPVPVRRFRA